MLVTTIDLYNNNKIMHLQTKRTSSENTDFQQLVRLLDQELRYRNGDIQDVLDQYNIITGSDTVVVAYIGDGPVGCGCFKEFSPTTVEIKRMFVHKDHRGKGVAASVLNELEVWAHELGYLRAVLETGTRLHEAVKLYTKP